MNTETCPHCGAEIDKLNEELYRCGTKVHGYGSSTECYLQREVAQNNAEIEGLKQANKDCMDWFEALRMDAGALWSALWDLSNDSQHINHDCGDEIDCPVANARKVLEETKGIRGEK